LTIKAIKPGKITHVEGGGFYAVYCHLPRKQDHRAWVDLSLSAGPD